MASDLRILRLRIHAPCVIGLQLQQCSPAIEDFPACIFVEKRGPCKHFGSSFRRRTYPLSPTTRPHAHLRMTSFKTTLQSTTSRTKCDFQGCNRTFGRKTELKRHKLEQHAPRKVCPLAQCNHRVKRTKLLIGHLEKKHGMLHPGMSMNVPSYRCRVPVQLI